jgi:broad specificity phosphatase PhoE
LLFRVSVLLFCRCESLQNKGETPMSDSDLITVKLGRHAESGQNTNEVDHRNIGDYLIPVTKQGTPRARKMGSLVGADYLRSSAIWSSPYVRPRMTCLNSLVGAGLLDPERLVQFDPLWDLALKANESVGYAMTAFASRKVEADVLQALRERALKDHGELKALARQLGAFMLEVTKELGLRYYEELSLREVEHGMGDHAEQLFLQTIHHPLFWRFELGGENGADCYDRVFAFTDSMHRQLLRKKIKNAMIYSHGLTIRLFVMRFLHLTLEQFELIGNPRNCDVITIAPRSALENPQFVTGRYGVVGLRLRTPT